MIIIAKELGPARSVGEDLQKTSDLWWSENRGRDDRPEFFRTPRNANDSEDPCEPSSRYYHHRRTASGRIEVYLAESFADRCWKMGVMNQSEVVAQAVVEAVLESSRMVYRSDQSQSVHDFDLHYSDGRVAAMEVTESANAVELETQAAIISRRRGGATVRAEVCQKAWRVRPEPGASINRIRASVDRYLGAIESAGIEHFFSASDRHNYPAVAGIHKDLMVSSGDVMEGVEPGHISIGFPIGGGAIGGSLVADAVQVEGSKADNCHKLSAAGTSERHLFCFVDVLNDRVWIPLVDLAPPPGRPELPPEITHVWVAGPARSGEGT